MFFISLEDTNRLFSLFDKIQGPNEYVGSVSFRKTTEATKVFKKMIHFVEGNLAKNEQFAYQTLEDDFYHSIENYTLIEHQDTLGLAKTYAPHKSLVPSDVLNEHMYILKKSEYDS